MPKTDKTLPDTLTGDALAILERARADLKFLKDVNTVVGEIVDTAAGVVEGRPGAKERLDKIARALADVPGLNERVSKLVGSKPAWELIWSTRMLGLAMTPHAPFTVTDVEKKRSRVLDQVARYMTGA